MTTGRPYAIASRIFRRVPPPIRNGTTSTRLPANHGAICATRPVISTGTGAAAAAARSHGGGSAPTSAIRAPACVRRGAISSSSTWAASTFAP